MLKIVTFRLYTGKRGGTNERRNLKLYQNASQGMKVTHKVDLTLSKSQRQARVK